MRLQNDLLSIPARRLLALLERLASSDATAGAALRLLRGWDAVETATSPRAALMELRIARHLGRAFKRLVLPAAALPAIPGAPDIALMLDMLEKPDVMLRGLLATVCCSRALLPRTRS